jgi:hypothetical protein
VGAKVSSLESPPFLLKCSGFLYFAPLYKKEENVMRLVKILLIVVLLSLPIVSYGTGELSSAGTVIHFPEKEELKPYYEEPTTLDGWFRGLTLIQKVEIYTWWEEK